jgi:hypothetical protein
VNGTSFSPVLQGAHQGVGCAFDCTKRFSSAEGHERQRLGGTAGDVLKQ